MYRQLAKGERAEPDKHECEFHLSVAGGEYEVGCFRIFGASFVTFCTFVVTFCDFRDPRAGPGLRKDEPWRRLIVVLA